MVTLSEVIFLLILGCTWLMGVVLAKGFWYTVLAACIPFYSWYLVVERFMVLFGLV
jgi:hypothetical protein